VLVTAGAQTARSDADGVFRLTNVLAGTVTLTPSLDGYGFDPSSTTFDLTADTSGILFTATPVFEIGGRITLGSQGLEGVTVYYGDDFVKSDSGGYYRITGLPAGEYDVEPFLAGYQFDPEFRPVIVGPSVTNRNFAASGALVISGTVTRGGMPLAGVTVTTTGRAALSTSSGAYLLTNLPPGQYVITPSLAGNIFDPTNRVVELSAADVPLMNFAATQISFTIRGRVTQNGAAVSNVQVSAGGQTVTNNAAGDYAISNLPPTASLAVVPARAGFTFAPAETRVALGPDTNGVDFVVISTNPTNDVRIAIAITNRQALLSFQGRSQQTYQLQAATSLVVPINWQTIASNLVAGTNGAFEYLDSSATNHSTRFYRTMR
jgi:hypothetical protein